MIRKKIILGIGVTDATKKEILEYIVKNLENFRKKLHVVTPNPEFLVLANKNVAFKDILNKADLASADGVGLMIAGKILDKPLKERFAGVDLVENLCEAVADQPITVGFLGGQGNVAEATAECLGTKYPLLKIAFVGEEWNSDGFISHNRRIEGRKLKVEDNKSVCPPTSTVKYPSSTFNPLPSKNVDILFVAFGAPKQEFWISENLGKIPVKVAIGIGGAFDYISGRVPRAPLLVQRLGFEWLFRLVVQPWRIRRQFALLEFVWLVVKEKLSKN